MSSSPVAPGPGSDNRVRRSQRLAVERNNVSRNGVIVARYLSGTSGHGRHCTTNAKLSFRPESTTKIRMANDLSVQWGWVTDGFIAIEVGAFLECCLALKHRASFARRVRPLRFRGPKMHETGQPALLGLRPRTEQVYILFVLNSPHRPLASRRFPA